MDATQQIDGSFCEEEDETDEEKEKGGGKKEREPLAALKVFKNNYMQETEVPLYQGENVLGRDPAACSIPLLARSISGRHAVISLSVFHAKGRRHGGSDGMEALLWDLGSLNGTRKGRMKLTPHVRYALTEGDSVVLADLPCQYISLRDMERNPHVTTDKDKVKSPAPVVTGPGETGRGVENKLKKSVPPVPIWGHKEASFQSPQTTPKQPERTLVPESDSDSDSEREKGGQRDRRMFLDSASSDLSGPTCSTFLTPANKVIPESEDESFITPSSAVTGRLTKNQSEASSDSLKPVPLNFNIDSDTEDEKEDEVAGMKGESEVKAASPPQVDPVDPACLHMDSDTDVEDEEVEDSKSSNISTVVAPKVSVTPAGCTVDSDTDVEEKEPFKAETVPSSGTKAVLEEKSSSEFHMESDTDVEDEDAPVMTKLETPVSIAPADPVAEFQMGSDTDAEEEEKPTGPTRIISDSDTEDEDPFKPTKDRIMENVKVPQAKTVQDNSNSDTDVEDENIAASSLPNKDSAAQVQPPAEKVRNEFRMDSDTDAEAEEEKLEEGEQKASETAGGIIIQYSTPRGAGLSEEEMETQAFLSPSQPFKRPALPSPLQSSVSPVGCTQDSDDFTVAETQSFVSDPFAANGNLDETRLSLKGCGGSPFRLGLSDSSHQQPDLEEHPETEEDWDLQATQLYATRGASAGAGQKRLDLEATQAYLVSEEREEKEAQPLEGGNYDRESNAVPDSERAGRAAGCQGEMMDSHPSTADTLILVRSPKLEEQTQPYALFTAQTLPLSVEEEEEEEEGEEVSNETGPCKEGQVHEEPTQRFEPKANNSVAIAETQLIVEDEEEEEQSETTSTRKPCRGREAAKIEPTQPLEPEEHTTVAVAETQPVGEDEETQEEEQPEGPRRFCEGKTIAKPEPTQPLEPEEHTTVAVAETQPVGEDEEEEQEEKQQGGTRRTRRGKKFAKPEPTQLLEPEPCTHAIAETQPVSEGEEECEKEQWSEPTSSRRSRRRKEVDKVEPLESDVAVAETQPMGEDEGGQEEEQQGRPRRLNRGRRTAKAEPTQPLKLDPSTGAEEGEAQEEEQQSNKRSLRGKGREPSGRGRGRATTEKEGKKKRGRPTLEEEEDSKVEVDEGRKGRGRKSMRQKFKERDDKDGLELEEEKDRETREEQVKMEMEEGEQKEQEERDRVEKERVERERAENEMKQRLEQEREEEERERGEKEREEENAAKELLEKERIEKEQRERLENENKQRKKEEKERLEREEMERLENEEREREEKERLEKEKREREEKERLEKEKREREEKEKLENEKREREERERLKKEKREREEKDRLENEKREREERERLEKEKREREEKERLENEKREREENERREKEERERLEKEKREREEVEQRLEKERREQEEKETLEKERKEREEKEQTEREVKEREKLDKEEREELTENEKKKKENEREGTEREKRQLQGRRRAGLGRKENEKKEDAELEDKNGQMESTERTSLKKEGETGETAKVKPSRGRRPGRKSKAPPAGTEEPVSADVPAKRTRSRSNSSNSVSSEQSLLSTLDDQPRGRGRGRGRRPAEEKVENSRPSRSRKTVVEQSSEMEQDAGPCIRSRSNSRSSERSGSSAVTQKKAKGGRGRKTMKVETPDEEVPQEPLAAPRGRGRRSRRPDPGDVKEDATEQAHQEKDKSNTVSVNEHSVISQTPSRGRKRSAETTLAESPQPTSKTPRRSLASQTHKVLFTGVVDEDGEKVLVRLGGGLAKGVGDMTHLVTDKVRRTVKFLCAVARGVPIVTLDWLTKCGKAGTFLSPAEFLVKDREQERKFNFNLQEALKVASRQPLLQGYEIHVTPSVKPEPSHMKDIISCCGARYLPKMPSAHKAQTVVVSCEEDKALCNKALSLAVPVVSAEFLLTGILQQKVDLQTHALSASPPAASKPAPQGRRK